jgi:hypothetical protein
MSALWPHSEAFVLFAAGIEEPLAAASKFVIDCLKDAQPQEAGELASVGDALVPLLGKALKTPKPLRPEKEKSEEEEVQEEAPAAEEAPAPAPEPEAEAEMDFSTVMTAKAELTLGKSKKKPASCQLRLLPDAEVLVWGAGTDIAEGDALFMGDVKTIQPEPPRSVQIHTNKAGIVLLQFEAADYDAWVKALNKVHRRAKNPET